MPGTLSPTSGPYHPGDIANVVLGTANSDNNSTAQAGKVALSYGYEYEPTAGTWQRSRVFAANSDALATTLVGQPSIAFSYIYGGSGTWEREQGNHEGTVLVGTVRVGNQTSTDQVNSNAKGMAILVEITVGTASGTIGTILVDAKVGTSYVTMYTIVPTTFTTGAQAYCIYPGASSAGNWPVAPVQGVVPRNYRMQVLPVTATATMTYSVVASYIL